MIALPAYRLQVLLLLAGLAGTGAIAEEHAHPAEPAHAEQAAESHDTHAAESHAPAHVAERISSAPSEKAAPVAAPSAPVHEIIPEKHPEGATAQEIATGRKTEARSLLGMGAKLTERGDYAAAQIAYWQVMNDKSYSKADQADALLGLARMFRKQAALTKAVATYEKFLKIFPESALVPDALLELGRCHRVMGAYKNAINRFYNVINSTLKLPPESYEHYQLLAKTAQFEIAETHFETGNFTDAAKFFDRLRLLDLAPEDRARAHFKSACSLLNGGQTEKAVGKFNQFIDQWPQDVNVPEARYLLALTLRQLGRTDEALNITLTLLRNQHDNAGADPKTWAYWQRRTGNQLANDFFQSGDTLSAVTIYEGLAKLSDAASWRLPIVYQMGLCYERLRQADKATQSYQEIIAAVAKPKDGQPVAAELTELSKMAEWRIGQLDWAGRTESHLSRFFSVNQPQSTPAATESAAAHDSAPSAAATPRPL